MRSPLTLIIGSVLLGTGLVVGAAQPARKPGRTERRAEGASYARNVLPLLRKYCTGCHGERQIAGINFHQFKTEDDLMAARALWERVALNVSAHHMPPKGSAQPTPAERQRLVASINATLARLDCDVRDPGRVTLRRLNRAEYNNTIRDLLGVNLRPADNFPSDDVGYGFDNIGDVLSISPLLMEKYLAAAEQVVRAATVAPEDRQAAPTQRFEAERKPPTGGDGVIQNWYRLLVQKGEVWVDADFPKNGEYLLRVRAFGRQSGEEKVRLALRLGEETLKEVEVAATHESPEVFEVRATVPAGKRRLAAAFVNADLRQRDRNLGIDYLEIAGPLGEARAELPESHRRLFFCHPAGPHEGETCARKILTEFARRAYRRPVQKEEVERLLRYVELAQQQGESFERGIQLAMQAVLVSPNFLFRVELDDNPRNAKAIRPLNDFELASRLSYFLWASMPDEELFRLAEKRQLSKPPVLEAQVRRMLKDDRAFALVENFARQWLTLRNLETFSPDPKRFPNWSPELKADMLQETDLFVEAIIREDRSILQFLDADFTFLNERLAKHYAIPGVVGDFFRRVKLSGPYREQRGGLLTQGSILAVTSNPTRTSPVKRGKWVLEQLLGTPPPPPLPDVPPLADDKQEMLTGTLRQRMEKHREDPSCASCHERLDPLGFGLENYDAIGAWRTTDGGEPIDASGVLPDGKSFNGPAQLRQVLLTQKEQFARAFTEKLLTYALGRGLEPGDRCAVDDILKRVSRRNYRFSAIVLEIVKSEPFRMRREEGG